eukprot:1836797-Rhodomonas_salina.1
MIPGPGQPLRLPVNLQGMQSTFGRAWPGVSSSIPDSESEAALGGFGTLARRAALLVSGRRGTKSMTQTQ